MSEMVGDAQHGLGEIAPETADNVDDNDYTTHPDSMMTSTTGRAAPAGGVEQRDAGGGGHGGGGAGGGHGQGHGGGGGVSTGQAETAQTPGAHPLTGTTLPRGTGAGSGAIQKGGRGGR